jgi:hypothetical protein
MRRGKFGGVVLIGTVVSKGPKGALVKVWWLHIDFFAQISGLFRLLLIVNWLRIFLSAFICLLAPLPAFSCILVPFATGGKS